MNPTLSPQDEALLDVLARVRAMLSETAVQYGSLRAPSADAMRKRMERLCEKGLLASSLLPSGRQLYRLSAKGVRATGAPSVWAGSPSLGVAAEALSVSAVAWKTEEFVFPKRIELEKLLGELASGPPKVTIPARLHASRFVLRRGKSSDATGAEWHLNYWLAEQRTAEELRRRCQVVMQNLRTVPALAELMAADLLGVTIAVPSEGVRATIKTDGLPVPAEVLVVAELNHLLGA